MLHCDPESLALRSLGEGGVSPDDDTHLATCDQCQAELASLRAVVTTARTGGPVELLHPSPRVWDDIRAELGLGATTTRPRDASAAGSVPPAVAIGEHRDGRGEPDPTLSGPGTDQPTTDEAPVVSLDARRARRSRPATWLFAAAAVGGVAVGGVVTAAVLGSTSEPASTVAATVDLAPLPAWDASGTADLTVTDDGRQVLVVTVDEAAPPAGGFQEVWLIDSNVEGMVSLGILDGTTGEFVIPDGVDVADFPIVDVSLEPFDGDPTHSGDSIVRGQIDA